MDCLWTFTSPGQHGSFVIEIHDLLLVNLVDYYLDYFTIGKGSNVSSPENQLLEESVFIVPGTRLSIEEPDMWVRLETGNKYRSRGFHLSVQRVPDTGE